MNVAGTVIAAYGRQYRVELADGTALLCFPRGKKSDLACGDHVTVRQTGAAQGVISAVDARQTLLYRSDPFKQKLIAANVTQVIVVVATEPPFSDELITRCIVAAESQDIQVLLILNKCDLGDRVAAAGAMLAQYEKLGYPLLKLSARHDSARLLPHLAGHLSLLIGPSGMGKSTLTNALVPDARAPTREISQALNTGKHTTTHARLYRLGEATALIDSPGLTEFGLHHLSAEEITQAFLELRPLLGQCRFRNCRHDREPDCSVHAALRHGAIDPRRYAAFRSLCADIG
ncbi:MAG: ribosome small subunit-dependent GTPase A [Candidatus Accumulibacter sp.]|nr:ribosome small subunit-dependent GTPase A [Accumulibacter sp.]